MAPMRENNNVSYAEPLKRNDMETLCLQMEDEHNC